MIHIQHLFVGERKVLLMKQISVNRNCSGCGLCIVNCHYLQENAEGNAEPVIGKIIQEKDLEIIKKVIEECPESALQIVDIGTTSRKGGEGITDVISSLKDKCNSFSVKKVSNSDVRLDCKDYDIPIPNTGKEYSRDYSSESSAKSTAKEEFRHLCYSETAYRPMIKKIFVEYKVNVLKPYYTCVDTEESAYYIYNKYIRELLSNAYAEICDLSGGNCRVPESWKSFSVYLSERDWEIKLLKEFDTRSTSSGIIADLKDRGEYTSISWYVDRFDYDYDETYVGEGLFGKQKYKDMWYFSGFYEVAKEFIDDLKGSIDSMSSDIEDGAVNCINYALESFDKKVKEELIAKISELEKYVKL
jgi:ferredoxin